MSAPRTFSLTPGKRVLYLTKDPERIRRQLAGELTLRMTDLRPDELLDDINTDAMTPAWVCFDYDPAAIARNAYAGLIVNGQRLIEPDALAAGNFEVIVAGAQKGVGSSRETAAQCEVYGQPAGDRVVVRADPRAQQHQHRPAHGRPHADRAARGRRGGRARRVHPRPRRDHRADHRGRRPVAVLGQARQGRDHRPADRHHRRGR
jgi:hypothetical protein